MGINGGAGAAGLCGYDVYGVWRRWLQLEWRRWSFGDAGGELHDYGDGEFQLGVGEFVACDEVDVGRAVKMVS